MELSINFLAVLLAAVAGTLVGFVWYGKGLFGKKWAALKGYTDESMQAAKKSMGKMYAFSFVLSLLMAYMLAHVAFFSDYFFNKGLMSAALTSAVFMWLGFVMPVQATNEMFGGKNKKLFLIDTGYQLASLLAMGLVIGLLR